MGPMEVNQLVYIYRPLCYICDAFFNAPLKNLIALTYTGTNEQLD